MNIEEGFQGEGLFLIGLLIHLAHNAPNALFFVLAAFSDAVQIHTVQPGIERINGDHTGAKEAAFNGGAAK